ncbi:MAG: type II secretion system protein [Bacilli bacterium]
MKKNGFTFIEILGVITLLALMSIIVLIVVDDSLKKSKETLSQAQIENIKSAASMWRTDHIDMIPDDDYYLLSLGELIDGGYIDNVIDPNSKTNYNNSLLINVGINDITVDDVLIRKGYTKLEYIESTGTQYIDTGYVPNNNTGIEADFQFNSTTSQSRVFGVGTNSGKANFVSYEFYINGSGNFAYTFKDGNGDWVPTNIPADTSRHTLRFNVGNKNLVIDNNNTYSIGNISNVSSYPIYIMAENYDGTDLKWVDETRIKLYSFKIYNGYYLIRNFVPAIRNSDNAVGLYDEVYDVFYTNSGTGEFIKGEL